MLASSRYFCDAVLMKARIKWVDGVTMLAESGSGHAIVMDGPPEFGGRQLGLVEDLAQAAEMDGDLPGRSSASPSSRRS